MYYMEPTEFITCLPLTAASQFQLAMFQVSLGARSSNSVRNGIGMHATLDE